MKLPRISINICVARNESIDDVIKALREIDYPRNLYEILIIKGTHLTRQRNIGVEKSKGQIIYLLDNDSQVHPKALKIIAKTFQNPKVAGVGGPSLTPKNEDNYFSKTVGYILETYFGAFRMRYKWSRITRNSEKVTDYEFIGSNLALKKGAVKGVGGFDEQFRANDETELLRRLRDRGYLLRYTHDLYVYRSQRKNIFQLAKQFHHYGRGRMQHLLKNPKVEDVFLLAPIFFLVYLLPLFLIRNIYTLAPLFFYIALGFLTSLRASIKYKDPLLIVSMTSIYPFIHISYALGLLHEFFNHFSKKRNTRKKMKAGRIELFRINLNKNYVRVKPF